MSHRYWANFSEIWVHKQVRVAIPYTPNFEYIYEYGMATRTRLCIQISMYWLPLVNVWGKRFKLPQLTQESFLTLHHSCKIFFWYVPNWTSTNLWCVVLYATYSTTHQRPVEVQFGRYQKTILQEWCRVKKLSCVSCGIYGNQCAWPSALDVWANLSVRNYT